MPINFFDENAKTNSSETRFGLCDDPPPAENPAYIDEIDDLKWIGIVNNHTNQDTDFYPVDRCIPLYRANGEPENRCDGVLRFNNNLIFVELKSREAAGWLGKGREQLTVTIQLFKVNYTVTDFAKIEAYVCNSLRPIASKNYAIEIQKFKDDTGLILNVLQNISI